MSNNGIWKGLGVDDLDRQPIIDRTAGLGPVREAKTSKRSRLERYIDILKVVNEFGPIRRTHILYKANLSWGDLEDSLGRLEQTGALQKTVSKSGVHYDITDAGKKFLANFVTVRELLDLGQTIASSDHHGVWG
ncbi:MAG: winged helix-turn-helix domain-containing protein [Nitrososphaerales archaeon]|nr:winged helix-turn-helix domain-containing protein [Nitrososphaerales archaeon]